MNACSALVIAKRFFNFQGDIFRRMGKSWGYWVEYIKATLPSHLQAKSIWCIYKSLIESSKSQVQIN